MDNMQLWLISSTDSINLNSGADGFYLNPDLDGLTGLPEIRSSNGVNGGYDGGWTSTQLWDARLITIRGLIVDKDGSAVEAKRKQLAKLVGQGKKDPLTLKFVSEAGHTYTCAVRTTNCTMALQNVYSRQEYQIQLRADDPLIYDDGGDDVQATLRVQTDSEGFEIPFDIPLDISGGADPVVVDAGEDANYPVITMYGELHSPTIVNQTTNQQLQLGADLDGSSVEWTESDTATGNPISLTNSTDYDAPILDFEMQGNATQASTPTPDAPVAVNTTTGENVVKITGKNLSKTDETDNPDANYVASGLGSQPVQFNSTYNGFTTQTNRGRKYANLQAGQSYTFSMFAQINPDWANNIVVYFYRYNPNTDTTGYVIASITKDTVPSGGGRISRTITIPEGWDGLYVVFYGATYWNNIQLEIGNSATSYEPYQRQDYEVNLGKNLLDASASQQGTWSNGSIQNTCVVFMPIITGETYTISNQNTTTWRFSCGICTIPRTGTNSQDSNWQTGKSRTITAQSNGYLYVQLRKNDNSNITPSSIPTDTFMIERGSSATSFAPYFTPLELAKIGTYQDRIYKNDGKWYVEKQVGKVVLDGSETWAYYQSYGGFRYRNNDFNVSSNNPSEDLICSHFTVATVRGTSPTAPVIKTYTLNTDSTYIFLCDGTSDVDAFKTWLASNPTTVYYALATPTTTEITNQALIDQLEAIVSAYLPQGVVNISLTGAGAQGGMVVEYGTGYIEIPADVAVIDCKDRTVMLNGANAYNLLAEGSEFIRLAPGENKLYLTSESTSDSGYAEVKFKTGNLSI